MGAAAAAATLSTTGLGRLFFNRRGDTMDELLGIACGRASALHEEEDGRIMRGTGTRFSNRLSRELPWELEARFMINLMKKETNRDFTRRI